MERTQCLRGSTDMQENNVFCSICTVNYSAYAGVLNNSLREAGHKESHYVLIIDYKEDQEKIIKRFGFIPIFLNQLSIPGIDELIKKYNAFELSNILKPFFIEWLLKNFSEVKRVIYLDTDIYVYNPLTKVINYLDRNKKISVLITQHITDYKTYSKVKDYSIEKLFIQSGLYNGGFYVLKNDKNSLQFLDWQKSKLFDYGYNDQENYMFVDQKILDFAPILFDYVGIYKNKTYNVAHWNYYEHEIIYKNDEYYVENEELTFFHFSKLKIDKKNKEKGRLFNIFLSEEPVLQRMANEYWNKLIDHNYEKIANIPYLNENNYKPTTSRIPLNTIFSQTQTELTQTQTELTQTQTELTQTQTELTQTQSELTQTQTELTQTQSELTQTQTELTQTQSELTQTQSELENKKGESVVLNNQLSQIYNSREWKAILKLKKVFGKFFPKDSFQRKFLIFSFRFFKKIFKLTKKVKKKIKALVFLNKRKVVKLKREKRKINLDSKKIVYIGHSYHNKTKSTEFLIEYLKEFFEVTVVLDESWQGKPAPNLSFIDESYLGVVFFQLLPSPEIISKIKNENIIYFPMHDQSGRLDFDFWQNYAKLKFVNFSKTLHQKLEKWGFESMYVQYFPELKEFIPGKKDEVFFWQRLSFINFEVIKKIFSAEKIKIHLHRAIDPGQQFFEPNDEDREKFKITFSDWFETREEMLDVIKQKAIYIAPREYEGIGLSFLEAMAMGKAVVANNQPTMNEYIVHNKTGYLFDWQNPCLIDFSNVDQVQNNVYEFMKKGRKKWEKERKKIIGFIKR